MPSRRPSNVPHAPATEAYAVGGGHSILIVDDNAANLIAIEAALEPLDRPLVFARSGVDALARLLDQDFGLILLDVAMPEMDGFETARMIRSRDRNRSTPIIFITGLPYESDIVLRAYDLGAFDFLVKPVRPEVLLAKAKVFMELQARTQELRDATEQLRLAHEREHRRELVRAGVDAAPEQHRQPFVDHPDVRAREQLYEAAQRARADAEAANRAKDEFLAMLGHELRNPLAPILTALQLMQLRGEGGERERHVIERQVKHMVRLVDDLLDISRIVSGKIEIHKECIELADVVEKAIEVSSQLLERRAHDLAVTIPKGLIVHGDPSRLTQVISNLLTNAAKYSDQASRITVTGHRDDDLIVLEVCDIGIGIAEEMLPLVFDLFSQEPQSLERSQGGLGLGLAIVRNLVMLHGGTVEVMSKGRGQGTQITVKLPAASSDVLAADKPVQSEQVAGAGGYRVLVVDDNRDAADMLSESLRSLGHTTRTAHDGPSALTIAKEFIPEVALLDIGLPLMDGYELAQLLRADGALRRLRLVALTGYGQERDRERSMAAGFDAHEVKPVPVDRVEELVRKLAAREDLS